MKPTKSKSFFPVLCLLALRLVSLNDSAPAQSANTNDPLSAWLNAQTSIQTWSADFVQTRNLKSLTQPLTESGHVWFAAPNRFHWELGHPAKTIAVRESEQLLVIYPRLKRAERYSLSGADAGPWKDTLALLDTGFPRSRAEIDARFNILSQSTTNGVHELVLQPKAEAARRFMPQIKIGFNLGDLSLHSTELQFADGSSMQNVFTHAIMNPPIDETLFKPEMGADYKIVEPLKK